MTENQNNPGLSCAWHIQQNATQRDTSLKCEIVTQFSDANCPKALLAYYSCGEGGDDELRSFFCKRVQCPKLLTRILQLNNFLSPLAPEHCLNAMVVEREVKTNLGHLLQKNAMSQTFDQDCTT